jgi:hypothetical protein
MYFLIQYSKEEEKNTTTHSEFQTDTIVLLISTFTASQTKRKVRLICTSLGLVWELVEWRVLGWRNFHYKSKFLKIPFNPLPSTWFLHFQKSPCGVRVRWARCVPSFSSCCVGALVQSDSHTLLSDDAGRYCSHAFGNRNVSFNPYLQWRWTADNLRMRLLKCPLNRLNTLRT